jgi:hypothetical protein
MRKHTVKSIKAMADRACFYVDPTGTWLRVFTCDETFFYATNEDTGEDYRIEYSEVAEQDNPHFEKLVRVEE